MEIVTNQHPLIKQEYFVYNDKVENNFELGRYGANVKKLKLPQCSTI